MNDMNIYQPQSGDIYEPVDRAQKFREQQNALARQQAVRNALAQSIDPRTGRTNWQQAYAMGGSDVAPDIQGLQQADMLSQAKLLHERGLGQKAGIDAETAYWTQQRDVASRIGDQASWSSWRSTLPAEFQQFVPEEYTPENQRMTLATADKALEMYKPDIQFQTTGRGVEGYDVNAYSPTYKQPVITAPAPPKTPAVQVNVGKAEGKFGEAVATGVGQNILDLQKNASSAIDSFNQNQGLYQYINSPDFISGTLGEPRLAIAKFLGLKGADETQVYMSQVGREVGNIVKMFGSGTAISEGDRKAAEKIAGGSMELTPQAIRSIMFIRQKANRHAAVKYNEELEKLRKNPRTAQGVEFLSSVPVPPPPAFNDKGWALWYDSKNKAYAYVSPDKKQVQETE